MGSTTNACVYCGLPHSAGPANAYCCFGCRLAHAMEREYGATSEGETSRTMLRLGFAVFLSMNVMVATMFLWSQPAGHLDPMAESLYALFRHLALVLSVPVLLLLGGPLGRDAWLEARGGRLSASSLLILGVGAAFLYSVYSVIAGGPVYFEVACMVLVFVTLGRYFEARGKAQTTTTLRTLERLLPDRVRRKGRTADEEETEVPLSSLEVGDIVVTLPGERIAVDGVVRKNSAAVDEQAVTGESMPVTKEPGDLVYSGTLNLDGQLWIEATAPPAAGAISVLLQSVLDAAHGKNHYQSLADRLSAWFLPLVLGVAAISFGVHFRHSGWADALLVGLAVVVIACPCALGLATPMAVWAAFGRASSEGVLVRNGEMFHRLASIQAICLDKTGTLTTGAAEVECIVGDGETDPAQVIALAGALARGSRHALAQAIVSHADSARLVDLGHDAEVVEVRTLPGRGLHGLAGKDGAPVWLGSERLMREQGFLPEKPDLENPWNAVLKGDEPVSFIAWQGSIRSAFVFRERLRDEARSSVIELQRLGLHVQLLTGDRRPRAESLGRQLGIDVDSNLLPHEKLARLRDLQSRYGGVAMVGDGLNDAPALAAADVGMALGSGVDLSRHTAGICLLGNDLRRIASTIRLARRLQRTIRWNLTWAFGYNVLGLAFAAAGWLHPVVAAAAMVVSSLFVISNSLQLAGLDEASSSPSESPLDETAMARTTTESPRIPYAEQREIEKRVSHA